MITTHPVHFILLSTWLSTWLLACVTPPLAILGRAPTDAERDYLESGGYQG